MTLVQQKENLVKYLKEDTESYRELGLPEDVLPVICNAGCIIQVFTFDEIDKMVESATSLQDLEILCQKTLNFNWSVGFDEVCEYAGIDVGGYKFLGL